MRPKSHQAGSGSAKGGLMGAEDKSSREDTQFKAPTTGQGEQGEVQEKTEQQEPNRESGDEKSGKIGERVWPENVLRDFANDFRGAATDLRKMIIKYPSLANILSDDAKKYEEMGIRQEKEADMKHKS